MCCTQTLSPVTIFLLKWHLMDPPSTKHISNTFRNQRSLVSLRCHKVLWQGLQPWTTPDLLCTGPFLSYFDQSIWGQHLRHGVPRTATRQWKRTLQKTWHSYSPLYLFPGKHDKNVSKAAETWQMCISNPLLWIKKRSHSPLSIFGKSLVHRADTSRCLHQWHYL